MDTKPLPIFRSDFIRRTLPTAGPGLLINAISMRTILSQGSINDYLVLDLNKDGEPHKKNACLFPKVAPGCKADHVCYDVEDISTLLDKGAVSMTFYLAMTEGNPDIVFSVQFKDPAKEQFYSRTEKPYMKPGENNDQTRQVPVIDRDIAIGIAVAHSIRENVFQKYLDRFWEDITVPPPFIILWSLLKPLIPETELSKVKMEWDDSDRSNNNLDVDIEDNETKSVVTRYSTLLFYGIDYLGGNENAADNVVEFKFYKGWSDTASLTILIEAVYKTGLRQFFDLSNEQP